MLLAGISSSAPVLFFQTLPSQKSCQKSSSSWWGTVAAPFPKLLATQDPTYHNWAQTQLVEVSSLYHGSTRRVFKPPPSDWPDDFSPVSPLKPISGGWRVTWECFAQINLVLYLLILLNLDYCVGGETYY